MKFICSLITVDDITKARKLYEGILHQRVISDFGENVAFEGGFALHQKDHFKQLIDNKEIITGANSFELYFEEDDLHTIELELKKEGFIFIHTIKEQPWRQQVLRFYDCDMNIIEIGERLEHEAYRLHKENKTIEEIMKLTYLSKKKIEIAISEYSK